MYRGLVFSVFFLASAGPALSASIDLAASRGVLLAASQSSEEKLILVFNTAQIPANSAIMRAVLRFPAPVASSSYTLGFQVSFSDLTGAPTAANSSERKEVIWENSASSSAGGVEVDVTRWVRGSKASVSSDLSVVINQVSGWRVAMGDPRQWSQDEGAVLTVIHKPRVISEDVAE